MIAVANRAINARASTLISDGVRFAITHRLLKDTGKVDFGTANTGKAIVRSTTSGGPVLGKLGTRKISFRRRGR